MVSDAAARRRVKLFENADEPFTRFQTEAESARLVNACAPWGKNHHVRLLKTACVQARQFVD